MPTKSSLQNTLEISFILLSIYSLLALNVDALIVEGNIRTKEEWVFISRFCYKASTSDSYGAVSFIFEYPKTACCQKATLYYDTQWNNVYPQPAKSCAAKLAETVAGNNQILELRTDLPFHLSPCKTKTINGVETIVCTGERQFISSRPRWWYLVFSHCNSSKGVQMKYRMEMTNGDSFWTKHFSADEQKILEPSIAFLTATAILYIGAIILAYVLKSRQLFHYTYKLFMASIFCELVSLLFDVVYYNDYGNTGMPKRGYKVLQQGFHSIGDLIFLLLLILLAKGWTVTRGRISSSGQVKLGVFFTLYSIAYIALYIYEAKAFDPGKVLYLYESPAGVALCIMRVIAWVWFCYGTFFTLKHYPNKYLFYYPFWFFYTVWFLSGPIIVLIATYILESYIRAQVMNGIDRAVAFAAYCFFTILTIPSSANKNFPYHVRTSQVGITNSDSSDNFAQHQYAPSAPQYDKDNGKPFSDITAMFSVKNYDQVKFGASQPHTNGTNGANGAYANPNPQGLLNGTPNSTPTGTPPEYERAQPNFNIFQASAAPKPQ